MLLRKPFFLLLLSSTSIWGVVMMGSGVQIFSEGIFLDSLSFLMIFIVCLIMMIILSVSSLKGFKGSWVLVGLSSFMFFSTGNWIFFYFLFEFSMIPVFYMTLLLGKQPERVRAGQFLLMYSILSAVPFFLVILDMKENVGSVEMLVLSLLSTVKSLSLSQSLALLASFLVKVPLFLAHSWLPKVHVEASFSGSAILAGISLKMGSFGVYRILHLAAKFFGSWSWCALLSVSLFGSIISPFLSLISSEMKVMIAFASVSHMNLALMGLLSMSDTSFKVIMLLSMSHSFSASLLFFLVTLIYSVQNSRNLIISGGLIFSSSIGGWITLGVWMNNMGIPPFLSFFGEIHVIFSMFYLLGVFAFMVLLSVIMNSTYSVIFFMKWSMPSKEKKSVVDKEVSIFTMFSLVFPSLSSLVLVPLV